MQVTPQAPRPGQPPARARRGLRWLSALAVLLALLVTGLTGYAIGRIEHPLTMADPLWLRGFLHRPLDYGAPGTGFWVTGYYVPYDRGSLDTLAMRAPHLDQVFTQTYGFKTDGTVTGDDPIAVFGATSGQKVVLVFTNLTDGKFSAETARALLTDPSARQKAIAGMVARVKDLGAAGVQLDFEDVAGELRPQLTAFVKDLGAALKPLQASVSLAVPAKTADDPKSDWSGAFDYAALSQAADYLVIMTYDEHYRGGDPGPVASLPWSEKVLRYAISVAPTGKLLLGIPGYGYDWAGAKNGTSYGIKDMDKHLSEVQAPSQYDKGMGERVATYRVGDVVHVAWYPDEQSLAAKLQLASKYNLKGVALWRLGFEPDGYWDAFTAAQTAAQKEA